MKYAWIEANNKDFKVSKMCKILKVSRSAYYSWFASCYSAKKQEDQELIEKIKLIFFESRCNYGARRIKKGLAKTGLVVSRRRVGRLMREANLSCKTKRKFKITTNSEHNLPIAPNLLNRQFEISQPDKIYVGDITYIHTGKGWLYLAVVIDLFSRKVVGWSMKDRMRAELVNDALLMALISRQPSEGLIWHTDRGSQYASDSHRQLLRENKIQQSMSRKGNCWDNAVSESFFHTLKTELVYQTKFQTKEEAKNAIFEYIEVYYNRLRLHSANNYVSPVEYEYQQNCG